MISPMQINESWELIMVMDLCLHSTVQTATNFSSIDDEFGHTVITRSMKMDNENMSPSHVMEQSEHSMLMEP